MNLPTSSDYPLILHGDCVEQMRLLPDASVDAVVTDPPYGINFMGKAWDGAAITERVTREREQSPMPGDVSGPNGGHRSAASAAGRYDLSANAAFGVWCETWLSECFRVLKPGGHALIFGGTRTYHRMAVAVEDSGFEIRDSIAWLYGSGFPKSLDVSKAIDKAAGAEREVLATHYRGDNAGKSAGILGKTVPRTDTVTAPATPEAQQWQGWGTALKPAFEPVVVARKPLDGTVAANVLEHGTGALNVDGCRIGTDGGTARDGKATMPNDAGWENMRGHGIKELNAGRWPANVILDEHTAAIVDEQSGASQSPTGAVRQGGVSGYRPGDPGAIPRTGEGIGYGDEGGASRFFYTAKANQQERPTANGVAHPTVKPLDLMRWLVRLVTPSNGIVLEPFAGSGTTVEACIKEDVRCIAIEREADYLPLIDERIQRNNLSLFAVVSDD